MNQRKKNSTDSADYIKHSLPYANGSDFAKLQQLPTSAKCGWEKMTGRPSMPNFKEQLIYGEGLKSLRVEAKRVDGKSNAPVDN